MKIGIVINGTRGDVQPMVALALALMAKGHSVIFCAPPGNEEWMLNFNIPFIPFGPNYRELFKKNAAMKGGATRSPSPKQMKQETEKQIDLLPALLKGADIILGVGFVLGVHTVADILDVPYRFVLFYPVLLGPAKNDPFINRTLFALGRSMTNMVMKGCINSRRKKAGLKPVDDVWSHWMGSDAVIACDQELNPAREDVLFKFTQTGYMIPESKNKIPEKVKNFLNQGKPPVYIGFGSNSVARPEKFTHIFAAVAAETHQRLIVSKGWADLQEENDADVLFIGEMPLELLFPQMTAVISHGGSGTLALAARAGVPQAAFPFMADQFENRKQIIKKGIGPITCDFKKISAGALINAINECVSNETYRKNAALLALKLQGPDGIRMTVDVIESAASRHRL